MGLLAVLLNLVGCDQQRIEKLEEGVSTEAQVRQQFGEPENVWDAPPGAPAGTRVLEYNRQPEGTTNYLIAIGPDGKMSALRQVLNPQNFGRVLPGMPMEAVRKMLGKPAKVASYALSRQTHWDYRFAEGANTSDRKIFTAIFDPDMRVVSTTITDDPRGQGEGNRP